MASEIAEIPDAVARLLDREGANLRDIGRGLARLAPPVIVTCARGSSDHAAGYGKYLAEILCGVPVASIGPSVASIYGARLRLSGAALLSVSQSGQSPDIVALQAAARAAGALTVAVVNQEASPLAAGAGIVVPIHAGAECSVAATKTMVTSAVALAAIIGHWSAEGTGVDGVFTAAVADLPDALAGALEADWSDAVTTLTEARSCYVMGRGPALPLAEEAALKLKETAVLHAEAYSSAELMHGPLQLITTGFPVVVFHPRDAAHASTQSSMARIADAGGTVLAAMPGATITDSRIRVLPMVASGHPYLDPLVMLTAFYRLTEAVARARGHDPDRPTLLRKVTETM